VSYQETLAQWVQISGTNGWVITQQCWNCLAELVRPGFRTLETGSGLSTWLFGTLPCQHIALENHEDSYKRVLTRDLPNVQLFHRSLYGRPLWYNWEPDGPKDLIFIDGPPGHIGREGILSHLDTLAHPHTIFVIDDTNREPEMRLAKTIADRFSLQISEQDRLCVLEKT